MTVTFAETELTVLETADPNIRVLSTPPSVGAFLIYNLSTTDISARGGKDYSRFTNKQVAHPPNIAALNSQVFVADNDDELVEEDETFNVSLSKPSGNTDP